MGFYDQPDFGGPPAEDAQPSPAEVKGYLARLADAYGLPNELVHAVAQTESGFDTDKVRKSSASRGDTTAQLAPESIRYGVMQVSDEHIGESVRDPDGAPLEIGPEIKNDWRANVHAGVALLAQNHGLAEIEQPFASAEEHAQQAYAGYIVGNPSRDRYLDTRVDDLPANAHDRAFLQNYRQAAAPTDDRGQTQAQPQAARPSSDQQAAQTQPQPAPAGASNQSSTAGLVARLQQLKENPGNLFLQPTPNAAQESTSTPSLGRIATLLPPLTSTPPPASSPAPARSPSLGNVASLLFQPQGTP